MTALRLCAYDSLEPSSAHRFEVVDAAGVTHAIAVVRILDDLYGIGDRCSHADVSLSGGSVWDDDCAIECPKHGSLFSLKTGAPSTFPATQPVATYAVRRVGDDVVVELP